MNVKFLDNIMGGFRCMSKWGPSSAWIIFGLHRVIGGTKKLSKVSALIQLETGFELI